MIRHRDVTRIEGFSDAVFGFALTLLVVTLEPLKDLAGLWELIDGLVPFALTFAMVCWIWWEHNLFFRRYDMPDAWTAFLNCVLLFVVLFYVYPLRFLATALIGGVTGHPRAAVAIQRIDSWALMMTYSIGVLAIFAAFALMYRHAWTKRAVLGLSEGELLTMRFKMRAHAISMALALGSIVLLIVARRQAMWAGLIYVLMGPLHAWNGYLAGKAHHELRKRSAPAE